MRTSTTHSDPWDRVRLLEQQVAELERRVNTAGSMLDANGAIIAATDATTGAMLGRPYLPITWAPARPNLYDYAYASGETQPGVDTVWRASYYKQHPKVVGAVETWAPAGASGALRLLINGTGVGGDRFFGDAATRHVLGPVPVPGEHLALVTLSLQMWITGGTGLVRCWPQDTYGVET